MDIELATLSKMDLTFDKYKSISLKKKMGARSMHLQFLQLERREKSLLYLSKNSTIQFPKNICMNMLTGKLSNTETSKNLMT